MAASRILGLLVLLLPTAASAGHFFGTVRGGGAVRIEIDCGGKVFPGVADSSGSYTVFVAMTGRCVFRLPDHPGAERVVFSFAGATRYDFALVAGQLQEE